MNDIKSGFSAIHKFSAHGYSISAVKAKFEDVSQVFSEIMKTPYSLSDAPKRNMETVEKDQIFQDNETYAVIEIKNSSWVLVFHGLFGASGSFKEAEEISQKLGVILVYIELGEEVTFYEICESGIRTEGFGLTMAGMEFSPSTPIKVKNEWSEVSDRDELVNYMNDVFIEKDIYVPFCCASVDRESESAYLIVHQDSIHIVGKVDIYWD
jgi:hypothetical protein